MNLLADAHISRAMAGFLRDIGHDVLHAEVLEPRLPDEAILRIASKQQRVILTADKDFGELVFRQLQPYHGVILLRFSVPSESARKSSGVFGH